MLALKLFGENMGWHTSDTLRLKVKIEGFTSITDYVTTPKKLAEALTKSGTSCLLGESNCESYLLGLVQAVGNKYPKKFVPFETKQGESRYEDALKEAGMLFKQKGIHFTPAGIAFLWDACGIHRDT